MANRKPLDDGTFEVFEPNDQRMMGILGNQNWHADSSYEPVTAKCGMLSAVALPDEGGQTELADMRAGYAALDPETKKRCGPLEFGGICPPRGLRSTGGFIRLAAGIYLLKVQL